MWGAAYSLLTNAVVRCMLFDERITLLHEILATTNFGEFQKFAKICCRQNLLSQKLIDAKINYMDTKVYFKNFE